MREVISLENVQRLHELTRVRCGWITGLDWSPDSGTLAIAGADGVRLYCGRFGGAPNYVLRGHDSHVKAATFSPDGRLLASVGADMRVRLWDVSRLDTDVREVAMLSAHQDSVDAVAFSPDSRTLATAGADGLVLMWNIETGAVQAELRGHQREVSALDFGLAGGVVLSGSWDKTLRLWDSSAETEGAVIGEHTDWVRQVRANPPGTMFASASKDMTVCLWDALTGERYAIIHAHWQGADSVAFSPDGSLMATGGRDNAIRLWDVQQVIQAGQVDAGAALVTLKQHDRPVMALAFNPAGTLLTSGSGDNTVRLWAVPSVA